MSVNCIKHWIITKEEYDAKMIRLGRLLFMHPLPLSESKIRMEIQALTLQLTYYEEANDILASHEE